MLTYQINRFSSFAGKTKILSNDLLCHLTDDDHPGCDMCHCPHRHYW